MSIDTGPIGKVAAELMEELPDEEEGKIIAVGIVVVVDCDDGETYTRIKAYPKRYFEQLGLFTAALEVVRHGHVPEEDED